MTEFSQAAVTHSKEGQALLRKMGRLMIAVGLVITLVNLVSAIGLRSGGIALVLVGAALVALTRVGQYGWAAQTFCWGLLFVSIVGAFASQGVGSVSWVALPIAAILSGWLLSRRAASFFVTAGIASLLAVFGIQINGYPFTGVSSPVVVAFALIAATLVSVLIGRATAEAYRVQLHRVGRSEAALADAQALARIGSWTMDPFTKKAEWSTQAHRIFGIQPSGLVEYAQFLERVQPSDVALAEAVWEAAGRGEATCENTYRIKVGQQVKWIRTIAQFVYDENVKLNGIFGTHQDITEQKEAQDQIESLSYHDPLTGLPNRVLARERLDQALIAAARHNHHVAVLYLDLDDFKHVNDRYGHNTGDLLLKAIAERVRSCLRAEDSLSRLSGDEFMVILPRADSERLISQACVRLVASLESPFEVDRVQLFCSFSIGVAVYPQSGTDCETLMRNADTALYEAKRQKGGYRFFEQEMNTALVHYLETRDCLRLALERGEFELYYQPQIDLSTGQISGVEALVRWNSPDRGLLLPQQFINIAETSGLIVPLGRWVLGEACRQAAAWWAASVPFQSMAVNLSSLQFNQGQVESDVSEALQDSGLAPALLELELTESTLLQYDHSVLDTVARWKAKGIRVAIDDFGTGYSNLSYLKRLNADKLKIDRSFVLDLIQSHQDRAIVQAIVQIGRSLGLHTTAEGVENPAASALLLSMGCDSAQGYYYGEPMPALKFEQWLTAYLTPS